MIATVEEQPQCPEGFTSPLMLSAKNNPMFAGLFACMDESDLYSYLCEHEQYRLLQSDMSVLLAAAHFMIMMTSGQMMSQATMQKQSGSGKKMMPVDFDDMESHWKLTMYGIKYYTTYKRPARAVAGLAWGV